MKVQSLSPVFQSKTPIYNPIKTNSFVNFTPIKDTVSFGKTQSAKSDTLSESKKIEIVKEYGQKGKNLTNRLGFLQYRINKVKNNAEELKIYAEELLKNDGMKDGVQVATFIGITPMGGYEMFIGEEEAEGSQRFIFDEKGNLKRLIQNTKDGQNKYRFDENRLGDFWKNEVFTSAGTRSCAEHISYHPYTGNALLYEIGVTEYGAKNLEGIPVIAGEKDEVIEFSNVLGDPREYIKGLKKYPDGTSTIKTYARMNIKGKPIEYSQNWTKNPNGEGVKEKVVIFDDKGNPKRYGENITATDKGYDVFKPSNYSNFVYLK